MMALERKTPSLGKFGLPAATGMVVLGSLLALSACTSYPGRYPSPVTVTQILEMSNTGTPPDEIVDKIRASGTVYRLKASQLAELQQKGVQAAVIDCMQQTYLDAVRRDAEYENWRHWRMYNDYWYGGAPFGWPYQTVYVIREHRSSARTGRPRSNKVQDEARRP